MMNNINILAYCPAAVLQVDDDGIQKRALKAIDNIIIIANTASEAPEHFNIIVTSKSILNNLIIITILRLKYYIFYNILTAVTTSNTLRRFRHQNVEQFNKLYEFYKVYN